MKTVFAFFCIVGAVYAQDKGMGDSSQLRIKAGKDVVIKDGIYSSIGGVFKFDLSAVGGKSISVDQREENPGITSVATIESDNAIGLAIVATKIRADYPKDDSLLDKHVPRMAVGKQIFGEDFDLYDNKENGRRFLQFTLVNESREAPTFPISRERKNDAKGTEAMGIHRFFVRSGYLIEVAVVVENADGRSKDKLRQLSADVMSKLVGAITISEMK